METKKSPMTASNLDFHVRNRGSIWTFTPCTDDARKACRDGTIHIEDWQWSGESFAVDHCVAEDLVNNLRNDGFTVR